MLLSFCLPPFLVTTLKNSLDALRAWAWDAVSHGCDSLFYFRWRQSVMGEENHPAILPHSGIPGATYQAVKRIGAELANLPSFPLPECPALIVCDMLTGFLSRYRDGGDYSAFRAIVRANQALNRLGIAADIVSAGSLNGAMLRKYRLVVLPQVEYLSDKSIAALRDYSGSGGVILAQGRLNRLDENGCFRTEPRSFRALKAKTLRAENMSRCLSAPRQRTAKRAGMSPVTAM